MALTKKPVIKPIFISNLDQIEKVEKVEKTREQALNDIREKLKSNKLKQEEKAREEKEKQATVMSWSPSPIVAKKSSSWGSQSSGSSGSGTESPAIRDFRRKQSRELFGDFKLNIPLKQSKSAQSIMVLNSDNSSNSSKRPSFNKGRSESVLQFTASNNKLDSIWLHKMTTISRQHSVVSSLDGQDPNEEDDIMEDVEQFHVVSGTTTPLDIPSSCHHSPGDSEYLDDADFVAVSPKSQPPSMSDLADYYNQNQFL
ncbi:Hypothetical protein PP7435_CHR3-0714 [Komagataella phaffii CBS 7435]|uniref:Uncharacterized protein n=2 Tax=Komagataella phaffii TaxID=460519 RepID=C4R4Q6_KOMPG|nr:Hypothetical protein PAS_chr3_0494 [Komagataella phaffii GS115]AOA63304.1 GQ67_03566T0 [Komagataella phaffii]CAH2449697.1 Hypothetical protein BQ9382_C3-3775 [Komagataella phaffii CBS 7435]AOA68631.1 GQ68_03536T0 [Komagataella phaffii GS115]CAY70542.1 Hypothetical protein PAS_chr3_0494 [Komagataella phaffii GS115]CCA39670.1 Hypothetical protein PP7435_CHR3-0714 [Komagataella phaffii CBS 7435]